MVEILIEGGKHQNYELHDKDLGRNIEHTNSGFYLSQANLSLRFQRFLLSVRQICPIRIFLKHHTTMLERSALANDPRASTHEISLIKEVRTTAHTSNILPWGEMHYMKFEC
jgi:hypothetical protein